MSLTEQFQKLASNYIAEHGRATPTEIAEWLVHIKRWEPEPSDMVRQCAKLLARAMRQEYIVDPQGRKVRAKHAVMEHDDAGSQTAFWDDIRTATRNHMHIAFQQRREQIVGDCRQLKTDVDSYNDNQNTGYPIQMIFDFTDDLEELEAGVIS
ncbi:MAG: hypothetical protein H8K07_20345 [Nitrospira sp.]|nr:hypothetical protein [Nitrospira sp.]